MRGIWACVGFTSTMTLVGACGGDTSESSVATGGGAGGTSTGASGSGIGGTSGGGARQSGVGGASASGGSAGHGGSSDGGASGTGASGGGGTSGSGGTGGGGGTSGSSGTAGGAGTSGRAGSSGAGGHDGSAGSAGTAGATTDGGTQEASQDANSPAGDARTDEAGNCGLAGGSKRIFISSALYTANLGGLPGADSKCQMLADAAGLCGTFKAWLSDATGEAANRLTHATGNYVLVNGDIVASGWSGLTSGTLQHAIDRTEMNGAAAVGTVTCGGNSKPVWTGSLVSGAVANTGTCGNWTSTSTGVSGVFGNWGLTSKGWTESCQLLAVCDDTAALYCLEQ